MLNPSSETPIAATSAGTQSLLGMALLILAIAAAAILGALGFQHIGGYEPCALCLMQRTPYYVGVPLAAIAVLAVWYRAPKWVLVAAFGLIAVAMLYNAGLAVYHSGVEWKFWDGPESCSQSPASGTSATDMLATLDTVVPASCSEAVWRFLGLSFAGWNVLISGLLTVLALAAARNAWRS